MSMPVFPGFPKSVTGMASRWHGRFAEALRSVSGRIGPIHVALLCLLYVLFSLLAGGGGLLHPEMDVRMPVELSGKPLLQILYDVKSMNIGSWETRQLSYLFDVLDGYFVALCVRWGLPHFRSLTQYLFTGLLLAYAWPLLTKRMRLDRLVSLVLLALLLTTSSFVFAIYYRTSKIGVSLTALILLGELYRVRVDRPEGVPAGRLVTVFFLTALAMTLFDILGVLFLGVLIAYAIEQVWLKPVRTNWSALAGLTAAFLIWLVHYLWLGPAIMRAVTGQTVDTSYLAAVPIQDFLIVFFLGMPVYFLDIVRLLFGNFSYLFLGSLALVGTAAAWYVRSRNRQARPDSQGRPVEFRRWLARADVPLFLVGGLMASYDLLATRHLDILLQPEARLIYYSMPAQAVLLFGAAAWLSRPAGTDFVQKYYFTVILVAVCLLAGNIIGTSGLKPVVFGGSLADAYTHTQILLAALKGLHTTGFVPPASVLTDPIFRLFAG
jgi:hypothetical protein